MTERNDEVPVDTTLWCVNIKGPDDVLAVASRAEAVELASRFNEVMTARFEPPSHPDYPLMWATPTQWPHDDAPHAANLGDLGEYAWLRDRAPTERKVSSERVYRHKKRGTEYVLIGIGKMQAEYWLEQHDGDLDRASTYEPVDMREVAIYRSVTEPTEIWVRPREEFEDGRFEALPTGAPPVSSERVSEERLREPLKWSDPYPDEKPYDLYVSASQGLVYHARKADRWNVTVSYWDSGEPRQVGSFDTLEQAKAAAQADYEQRILSAIEAPAAEGEAAAGKGEQRTLCDACGNSNLAHDRAVWTDDGSSFCPGCAPSPAAASEVTEEDAFKWPPGPYCPSCRGSGQPGGVKGGPELGLCHQCKGTGYLTAALKGDR